MYDLFSLPDHALTVQYFYLNKQNHKEVYCFTKEACKHIEIHPFPFFLLFLKSLPVMRTEKKKVAKVEFEVIKMETLVSPSRFLLHDSELKFVSLAECSFGRPALI